LSIDVEKLVRVLESVREKRPVVHTITNWVTAGDVSNALQAIGARPVMAVDPEEVEEIVSGADAEVLNLGTPDPSRVRAMLLAGCSANRLDRPVVFDPVGVGASRFRTNTVQSILSQVRFAVIRGNRAEIGTMAKKGGELRGIDAVNGPEDLFGTAEVVSQETGATVVLSGPQDLVVGSERAFEVANGHFMMGLVTGTGCILSAIIGAFAAVEKDSFVAAASAVAFFGLAGERAALQGKGPGTFKTALFDALFALTSEDFKSGAKIKVVRV